MSRKSTAGLATFFLVAFGFPWAGWTFVQDDRLSLWLFPLFASIAGFSAAFAEGGRKGLGVFSRRVFRTFGALRYVLAGAALPLLIGLGYLLTQGVPLAGMPWSPLAVLTLSLGAALVTGPIAEEFGWRGYLQHRLLSRLAPFWTALVVGGLWWAWHFALYRTSVFASPAAALNFLAYLLTWSIFMAFLVERAGGSVWPAVALHWVANTHPDILRVLLPSIDGGILPGGSKGSLFYLGVAVVFALLNRRFFFARTASAAVPHAGTDSPFGGARGPAPVSSAAPRPGQR
jgi:membrane protease YdiL (CAAX protease family)